MNPETTMPSNNGDKEEVEGTIIRYKPTLETIYETSEGVSISQQPLLHFIHASVSLSLTSVQYSEMLPDRQVVSAKKLKPTRIPRAQRRRPQERASISEETMSKYYIIY